MNKEPTRTIYQCLAMGFWMKRKCQRCQKIFTKEDYHQHNYYLTFEEVEVSASQEISDHAVLESVIVYLSHQHCQLTKYQSNRCQIQVTQSIYQKKDD